jgi:drug/metabolite transporter (DMT)-like permease
MTSSSLSSAGLPRAHDLAAYALLIAAGLAWSGNVIVVRAVHDFAPPFAVSFWRCVLTILVLLPFVWRPFRAQWPTVRAAWRLILAFGVLQFVTGQALLYLALDTTTAVNAGLLNVTQPAITAIVAWFVIRDRLSRWQIGGIAAALVGVVVIVLRGELATLSTLSFVIGDLWVELALLSWSLYSIILKRSALKLGPFVLLWASCVPAGFLLFPLWLIEMAWAGRTMALTWETTGIVAYVGFFGTIVGMAAWNEGNLKIGPSRAASFLYLIPVFTVVLAVIVLGEAFEVYHLIGMVLVFGGVALANRLRPGGSTRP